MFDCVVLIEIKHDMILMTNCGESLVTMASSSWEWRVVVNILNVSNHRHSARGGSAAWGNDGCLTMPCLKKLGCCKELRSVWFEQIILSNLSNQKWIWNSELGMYRSDSLTAATWKLAKYKIDFVGVEEVRWDKSGTEVAYDYKFFSWKWEG
jgi:hypothetical protein